MVAWTDLVNNPPIIYGLTIETNADSKPVLHSFRKEQVDKIIESIKSAMRRESGKNISINVESIIFEGDERIENIGSTIYNQTVGAVA